MTVGQKRHILIGIGLGLVLGLIVSVCFPDMGFTRGTGEGVLFPKHYPDRFSGIGHIDRIAKDEIVIDDSLYKLSPFVKYHTPRRTNTSRSWFRAGSLAGFMVNSGHEIVSLWLIE